MGSASVTYSAYTKGKWLSSVTNYNDKNTDGYAGIEGCPIQGLKIDSSDGDVYYRAKLVNGGWLDEVSNSGSGDSGYAGEYGKDIDCVQIRVPSGTVKYRAHTLNGKWLDWVTTKSSFGSTSNCNSYAGVTNKSMDMFQISFT